MKKGRINVKDMCLIALLTALTAVMAQISIPMPLGTPMTLQTFAICLSGILLGRKGGALSALLYLLLGCVGIPVFANFSAGLGILIGPTGGFLLSFPVMAFIIGLFEEKRNSRYMLILGLALGVGINWICGMIMFRIVTGSSLTTAFMACVLPFIPTGIIKAVTAGLLGRQIKKRIPMVV